MDSYQYPGVRKCAVRKCNARKCTVGWLYAVAVGHVIGAVIMTVGADAVGLLPYHQQILASFGFASEDQNALEFQRWWMALFGATLQAFSLALLVLIYIGDRYRNPVIWAGLVLLIVWWVPQDIFISLQRDAWLHVWVDIFAAIILVVPLVWLWNLDRKLVQE